MLYDKEKKEKALKDLERRGLDLTHRRIIEMTGKNKKVLEVGCATGYVSKELKKAGCSITGIEIDPEAAKQAETHCDKVLTGDIETDIDFSEVGEKFDVILMGDVLEHLKDPESILKELRKMLQPFGYILVTLPNVAFYKMRWDLLLGRFEYSDFGLLDRTHLRFYTFYSFHRCAARCGFRIADYRVNEGRFPLENKLRKVKPVERFIRKVSEGLVKRFPNLFGFHFIFKLEPDE